MQSNEPAKKKKKCEKNEEAAKNGETDETSEDNAKNEDIDDNQRVKRRFVNRNLHGFSEEFQNAWQKLSASNQKKLLAAIEKDGRNYVLNEKSQILQEMYTTMERKSARCKKEALPKTVMQAQLGGKDAFQEALAEGDIVAVEGPKGKTYYTFEKYYLKESKQVSKGGIVKKDDKITDEQVHDVDELLKEFHFSFEVTEKQKGSIQSAASGVEPSTVSVEAWADDAKAKLESGIAPGLQLQTCVKDLLQKEFQSNAVAASLKEQLSAKGNSSRLFKAFKTQIWRQMLGSAQWLKERSIWQSSARFLG